MANRHVMIPEDIWRGMLHRSNSSNNPPTGDINLDYSRRSLDSARKNIQYNQQLRRYLHLRKQHENRPVKVEVVAGPNGAIPLINNAMQQPTSMYSGLNSDGGDDGGDDPWFDDDLSFQSLPAAHPYPPPPPPQPQTPPPPSSRQAAKRKKSGEEEEGNGGEAPPTKKIKIEQAAPPPARQRRVRQRPPGRRQRQRRQQRERLRRQQQIVATPRDVMRSDQPDEDAAPGPSNSLPPPAQSRPLSLAERRGAILPAPLNQLPPLTPPPRRGVKRRPLLSMRPPLFYSGKRHKPNPPKPRKRGESESPPPTKQFRPSLW